MLRETKDRRSRAIRPPTVENLGALEDGAVARALTEQGPFITIAGERRWTASLLRGNQVQIRGRLRRPGT